MASLTLDDVVSVSGTPTNFLELSFGIGPIPNDPVFVERVFMVFLQPGGSGLETRTTFAADNETLISLAFADNILDVVIIPHGPGLLGIPDHLAVRTSTLHVECIPVPASLGLMIIGLAGVGFARRRMARFVGQT
jgi:hypothetical protein